MTLNIFQAGKGINATKLNANFNEVKQQANTNESNITTISNTALKKDGTNLTQSIIDTFQQQTPNILSRSGTISLADNTANFLTLTGNGTISLPAVASDQYSHTISLVVAGGSYSLDINTATGGRHLFNSLSVNPTKTYSVLFIYNKLDNHWYYSLTQ